MATAVRVIIKKSGNTPGELVTRASVPRIAEILIDNMQRTQQIKKERRRLLILSENYIKQKQREGKWVLKRKKIIFVLRISTFLLGVIFYVLGLFYMYWYHAIFYQCYVIAFLYVPLIDKKTESQKV